MSKVAFTSDTLTNGLRVVFAPDESASGVAVNLSFDAGTRHELPTQAGAASLLHPLIVQKLQRGIKSERVEGAINQERASYIVEVPQLEGVLSEIVRQLQVTEFGQTALEEQRSILLEEWKQLNNQPYGRVQETLLGLIYEDFAHQYGAVGSLPNLDHLSLEVLRSYFQTWYVPNNAVLIVAGNFKEQNARKMVDQHFGVLSHRALPEGDGSRPPTFSLERRTTINDPHAEAPYYMSAYLTVPGDHPDWYALNVLADILGQGDTARLYLALVAKNLASSVPEGMTETRGPSLLYVGAKVLPDVRVATVEAIMDTEFVRIQQDGITEPELDKARAQEGAYSAEQLRTPAGKANFLARATLYYNDPDRVNTELDRMLAVTAQDVQRVAQTYLVKTNRAVVIALPKSAP